MAELAYARLASHELPVQTSSGDPGGTARCGAGGEADVAGRGRNGRSGLRGRAKRELAVGLLFGVTLPTRRISRPQPVQAKRHRSSPHRDRARLALPPRRPPQCCWPRTVASVGNWNGPSAAGRSGRHEELTNLAECGRPGEPVRSRCWNEPDHADFWNGTRDQFHGDCTRGLTQKLRTELGPKAEIGGPTFGSYDHDAMAAFLEFCLARGCEVNALIFHAADDSPAGLAAYPANVRDARVSFLENPRYAPLRIQRIINNEIVGPLYTHQPAGTLAYYAAFEAGGAALAAHSCWPENFVGECDRHARRPAHAWHAAAAAAVGLVGALALRGGRALPRRGDGQHGQPGRARQRRFTRRPRRKC